MWDEAGWGKMIGMTMTSCSPAPYLGPHAVPTPLPTLPTCPFAHILQTVVDHEFPQPGALP